MFCTKCGKEVQDNSQICENCGKELKTNEIAKLDNQVRTREKNNKSCIS